MVCECFTRKAVKITLWITLPILVFSVVMIIVFPTIYNSFLEGEITLKKGSIVADIWKDIPLPVYENAYFFNITNKEFFLNGSQPLNVTEVGPYCYKAKWVKRHPHWHANNTVSYREVRTYHFVPEMSNGTEDDVIYTLNGPMLIAANIAKSYPKLLRAVLSFILGIAGEEVIIERSIRELTYQGYDDLIIKYAPHIILDIPFKDGKFSWLYGKNATNDGLFTVFTGVDDALKAGIINNWNGQELLKFWKGDTCNMMNGTNIETGPPIKGYQESYTFFQSIFCRSLTFNYTSDEKHYDIPVKRFRPTYELFANGSENPDNYCFDVNGEYPSGVLSVSSCQFGAPVFISFPHFHLADSSYLNYVNGLSPNDNLHGSHIDVEPITGVSVDIAVRFQINVEISEVEGIFQTYNVSKGIFPILWVDLNLKIDEHFANYFKSKLNNPKIIAYSVLGVLAGVSLLLVIVCIVVLSTCKKEEDDDDPLLDCRDHSNDREVCNPDFKKDDESDEENEKMTKHLK